MTITKAKAPQGVFSTTTPISEGLKIPAGESAYQTVTFTPTAVGQAGTSRNLLPDHGGRRPGRAEGDAHREGHRRPHRRLRRGRSMPGDPRSSPRPVTDLWSIAVAGGKCQDYVRGVICWSPATGAHAVLGEIYKRYKAAGGAAGVPRLPDHRREGVAGQGGAVQPLLRCGRVLDLLFPDDRGALRVLGAIRSKWTALGCGDRTAGLSDHRREAHAGRGGAVQPLLRCGRGIDLLVADDQGALGDRVRSGPSGRRWAGRRAWAIRPPTTDGVAGRGGAVQPLLRWRWKLDLLVADDGGALCPGCHPGQVGGTGLGDAVRWATRSRTRRARPDGVGRYNHFSGSRGTRSTGRRRTGAHSVHGCDPGEVGVTRLGDEPAGLSRPRRVLHGIRRSGIGFPAWAADVERNNAKKVVG